MSIYEVITGKKPLFRSTQRREYVRQIESEFASLINRPSAPGLRYTPQPSAAIVEQAAIDEQRKTSVVSKRITLPLGIRTKILDDRPGAWDVYITVPIMGTTAYAAHDGARALYTSANIHEGIPLTNNPAVGGRPTANHLKWKGDLWLSGDTDNMVVDIEAS